MYTTAPLSNCNKATSTTCALVSGKVPLGETIPPGSGGDHGDDAVFEFDRGEYDGGPNGLLMITLILVIAGWTFHRSIGGRGILGAVREA